MSSPQVGEGPQPEVNASIGSFQEDSDDDASEFQGFLDEENAADENAVEGGDEGFAEEDDEGLAEGGHEGLVGDEGIDDQETSGNTGSASTSAPSVTDGEVNSNARAEVEAIVDELPPDIGAVDGAAGAEISTVGDASPQHREDEDPELRENSEGVAALQGACTNPPSFLPGMNIRQSVHDTGRTR